MRHSKPGVDAYAAEVRRRHLLAQDLAFKKAMLRARCEGTENFEIGVVRATSARVPHRVDRPVVICGNSPLAGASDG